MPMVPPAPADSAVHASSQAPDTLPDSAALVQLVLHGGARFDHPHAQAHPGEGWHIHPGHSESDNSKIPFGQSFC